MCYLNGRGKVMVVLKCTNVVIEVTHAHCKVKADKPGSIPLAPKGEELQAATMQCIAVQYSRDG